ncbi:MAG: glycosyltransferase family 25 protein [Rhodobacteraceae bacterium]|nr:glycosyltransferase family 25 protein [Paracoccaceae bacterium]
MQSEFPIFLINLDRSVDRLALAQARFDRLGRSFQRIAAVDGRTLSPELGQTPAILRFMGRALSPGEIGCIHSHHRAAEALLATGAPYGLVMEDDADPKPELFACLTDAARQLDGGLDPDWFVINAGVSTRKFVRPMAGVGSDGAAATLLANHYPVMSTHCLFWSRQGAMFFLQATAEIMAPADILIRHRLGPAGHNYCFDRVLCPPNDLNESSMEQAVAQRRRQGRHWTYGWRLQQRLWSAKAVAFWGKLRAGGYGPTRSLG